ncbi:MAG: thymidylate synthase [Clostridia bacterium]|nr:thymidylate synthase [Clostridia bacterium]
MSYADKVFKETVRDILDNGTDTKNQEVRPVWEDGTKAYTIKKSCIVNTYDLEKEFPAITLRRIYLKSALDEVLWIYQKKSNNIHDLNSHIWDEWADKEGSIGKAYGYQIGKKFLFKRIHGFDELQKEKKRVWNALNGYGLPSASFCYCEDPECYKMYLDQMDAVIYQLTYEPFTRRIMTSSWNFNELADMGLMPCAYSMTYNVEERNGVKVLNAILNQRSQDMLAANGWNVAQYALLLMMIARSVNMVPGKLVHVIADCHIYDRHVPLIKELLDRYEYPAPKVYFKDNNKTFYEITTDDLVVEDYKYGEQIKNIPIAI